MSDLDELKTKILEIARERKADYAHPVSISDLVREFGEPNRGLIQQALFTLTLDGKIGTKGTAGGLNINKVY